MTRDKNGGEERREVCKGAQRKGRLEKGKTRVVYRKECRREK